MSRLIDAEIAYDKIAEQETSYYMDMEGVQAGLDETPTVDAVPVVRCEDCKWFDISEPSGTVEPICYRCKRRWIFVDTDDFCKHGERREEDE